MILRNGRCRGHGRFALVQLTHTARRCETLHVRRRKLVNKGEKFGKDNARIENTRKGTRYEEGRKEGRKKVGKRSVSFL